LSPSFLCAFASSSQSRRQVLNFFCAPKISAISSEAFLSTRGLVYLVFSFEFLVLSFEVDIFHPF